MTGDDRRRMLADARLYLVAPARIAAGPLAGHIPALADAGVDIVQLRDRTLAPGALLEQARACAAACARAGILFLVNDDPALARACGADGVHVGQDDLHPARVRELLGPDRLIGRSTRGGAMLERAAAEGADYASVGPIWPTPTKPGRAATGLAAPAEAAAAAGDLPWFAIGGIDGRRIGRVAAVGATRAVVVRAICDAADPAAAARDLRARLVDACPRVLSVASTDSGGGAGTLADAKAIVRAGGFPMCALVGLTAQSTVGVRAVRTLDLDFIHEQIACCRDDIGLDGVKTGMLATPALVASVAGALAALPADEEIPIVVDPVLRAESGAALMAPGGEDAYRTELLHLATVCTPNLFEAQALAGGRHGDPERLARTIHERHGCAVIVTGGHGDRAGDTLCDEEGITVIPGVRLPRASTHGAGCTHSSTLAAELARGRPLRAAAVAAKRAATDAVARGRPFGAGAGPVDVIGGRFA